MSATIYNALVEFNEKNNKTLKFIQRNNLNIVLPTSLFFTDNESFLTEVQKHEIDSPFVVSTFKFSEVEIDLLLKYSNNEIVKLAKERLLKIKECSLHNSFSYFKYISDIVQIEKLDVPICFLICNINEAINTHLLSVKSNNLHICFDAYEKKILNEDELHLLEKNFFYIRQTALPYDSFKIPIKSIKKTKNIFQGGKIIVNKKSYFLSDNIRLKDIEGGEASIYKLESSSRQIVKIFNSFSETKMTKVKLLLSNTVKKRVLSDFCVLPDDIVLSNDGKEIGYVMENIEGDRLDQFVYKLSQNNDTTIIQIVQLYLKVALSVHAVHLSDFVIGDIHANNFIVTHNNKVKIVDCDSFNMLNYPCDGLHYEAFETFSHKHLSYQSDFFLLNFVFDDLLKMFKDDIRTEYFKIKKLYKPYNDVIDFIYAFYYFLKENQYEEV